MLARYIASQLRRPTGWFGRFVMTRMLNSGNAELIGSTLEALSLESTDRLLDVGFGGGRALLDAAKIVAEGTLRGVDFSPDVVQQGMTRYAKLIAAGRLTLKQGDVAALPLDDGAVTKIMTTNTIYFWPEPQAAAKELLRVLAPGGLLVIGYSGAKKMADYGSVTKSEYGFRYWEPQEVEVLLVDAGFESVETIALDGKRTKGDFVTKARRGRV